MRRFIYLLIFVLGLSGVFSEAVTIKSEDKVYINRRVGLKKLEPRVIPWWCNRAGFYILLDISKDVSGHSSWNSAYASRPAGGESQFAFLFKDVKRRGDVFVVRDENGAEVTIGRILSSGRIHLEKGVDVNFSSVNGVITASITK
jgi:hypothetical protein